MSVLDAGSYQISLFCSFKELDFAIMQNPQESEVGISEKEILFIYIFEFNAIVWNGGNCWCT